MENTDKQQQFKPINRSVLATVNDIARTHEDACNILKQINPNFDAELYKDCPNLFNSIIEGDCTLYGFVENSKGELESFEMIESDTDITKFAFILDEYIIAEMFMDMHNDNIRENEALSKIADILENGTETEECDCKDCDCEENEEIDPSEICSRECLSDLAEEYDVDDIVKILEKDGIIIPELNQLFLEDYINGERLIGITEVRDSEGIHFESEEINGHNLTKEFDYIDVFDNIVNQYMLNLDSIYGCPCDCEDCASEQSDEHDSESDEHEECENECCEECDCEDEESDEYFFAPDEQEDEECLPEDDFLPMLDNQVFDNAEMTLIRTLRGLESNNIAVVQSTDADDSLIANFKGDYIPALDGIPLSEKECQILRTIRLLYV